MPGGDPVLAARTSLPANGSDLRANPVGEHPLDRRDHRLHRPRPGSVHRHGDEPKHPVGQRTLDVDRLHPVQRQVKSSLPEDPLSDQDAVPGDPEAEEPVPEHRDDDDEQDGSGNQFSREIPGANDEKRQANGRQQLPVESDLRDRPPDEEDDREGRCPPPAAELGGVLPGPGCHVIHPSARLSASAAVTPPPCTGCSPEACAPLRARCKAP